MLHFGLIGYPLSHSFSRGYFTEKFHRLGLSDTYVYHNFPLPSIEEFPALIQSRPELLGLNVTIPYKRSVIPFLDELDAAAAEIGAVNTIHVKGGRLKGYNTDVVGFGQSLDAFLARSGGPVKVALVLGTGGAAAAVAWALRRREIPYRLVSRKAGKDRWTYPDLTPERLARHELIINTTPLGMAPRESTRPELPYHALGPQHRLYDLVYNPAETLFLRHGRLQGAATINGLEMLHGQAEAAWAIWQS